MFKKIKKYAVIASVTIAAIRKIEAYGKKVQDKESQKEIVEKSRVLQAAKLREKFDQIKVGDLSDEGNGGSSEEEVIELLGDPKATTDSTIQDIAVKVATWRVGVIVITIQFENDRVISKNISGFKWGMRPIKLDLETFEDYQPGEKYSEIVTEIGEPDGINESKINGVSNLTATWRTGLAGGRGASVMLMFRNGKLISKSQANLL